MAEWRSQLTAQNHKKYHTAYCYPERKKNQNSKREMSPLDTCHSCKLKILSRIIVIQGLSVDILSHLALSLM